MTKDGKPYGPARYKQLVQQCYIIAKNLNTSYIDARDNLTPSEASELLRLMKEDAQKQRERMEKMKEQRKQNKNKRGNIR